MTGLKFTCEQTVTPDVCASAVGSGDMDVYATPMMVALMERAAMTAVRDALPDGSSTVGTLVNVSHVKASPIGAIIKATATVTQIDGRRIVFRVEASDSKGLIGEGTHERFVVDREKFLSRL